jgi:manganese/zinc/iron transport system permease protein
MIVTSIIIGLQTVGVILMSAMLTAPAVAARQWTDKLSVMVILSATFGVIAGVIGTILSSVVSKLPTGPTIVIVISTIVIFSLAFAPNRGLIWKYFRDKKNKREINEDQVLTNLYHLAMNHDNVNHSHDILTIKPDKSQKDLMNKLESLINRNLVEKDYFNKWSITEKGIKHVENYFKKEEE